MRVWPLTGVRAFPGVQFPTGAEEAVHGCVRVPPALGAAICHEQRVLTTHGQRNGERSSDPGGSGAGLMEVSCSRGRWMSGPVWALVRQGHPQQLTGFRCFMGVLPPANADGLINYFASFEDRTRKLAVQYSPN